MACSEVAWNGNADQLFNEGQKCPSEWILLCFGLNFFQFNLDATLLLGGGSTMKCQWTRYSVEDLRDLDSEPHGAGYLGRGGKGRESQENVCLQYPGDGTAEQPKEAGHREPCLVLVHHHTCSFRLSGNGTDQLQNSSETLQFQWRDGTPCGCLTDSTIFSQP